VGLHSRSVFHLVHRVHGWSMDGADSREPGQGEGSAGSNPTVDARTTKGAGIVKVFDMVITAAQIVAVTIALIVIVISGIAFIGAISQVAKHSDFVRHPKFVFGEYVQIDGGMYRGRVGKVRKLSTYSCSYLLEIPVSETETKFDFVDEDQLSTVFSPPYEWKPYAREPWSPQRP